MNCKMSLSTGVYAKFVFLLFFVTANLLSACTPPTQTIPTKDTVPTNFDYLVSVVDSANGNPVSGAIVTLSLEDGQRTSITDDQGNAIFNIPGSELGHVVRIVVQKDGSTYTLNSTISLGVQPVPFGSKQASIIATSTQVATTHGSDTNTPVPTNTAIPQPTNVACGSVNWNDPKQIQGALNLIGIVLSDNHIDNVLGYLATDIRYRALAKALYTAAACRRFTQLLDLDTLYAYYVKAWSTKTGKAPGGITAADFNEIDVLNTALSNRWEERGYGLVQNISEMVGNP